MWVSQFYSVLYENKLLKADTIVEARVYVNPDGRKLEPIVTNIRYPVDGKFKYGWMPTNNLLEELPPQNWLADKWIGADGVVER